MVSIQSPTRDEGEYNYCIHIALNGANLTKMNRTSGDSRRLTFLKETAHSPE